MIRSLPVLLTALCCIIIQQSTTAQSFIILRGAVISNTDGKGIPYATIALSQNDVKTMSNEDGRFIFKIPAGDKTDRIYVSHVGYQSKTVQWHSADTGLIVVRLEESFKALDVVTIKAVNPVELIRLAIAHIPDNYSTTPHLFNSFYRLTGKKEKRVVDLSEAALEIYNENYTNGHKQFKVLRARVDKDLTAFGGMDDLQFGEKPDEMMESDIVSNAGQSGLLSEQGLKEHSFTYRGIVNYEGHDAHAISFDQKDGVKKSLNKGMLYIDVNSLAFLQFNTWKSPKGIKYWDFSFKQRMLLKLAGIRIRLLQDSSTVVYRKFGDKYYLSHINGSARWHIIGGRHHFELDPLYLKYNYLVTGIDTNNVIAFNKDEVHQNERLVESKAPDDNTDSTDAFWGSYNLLQAEFNVDSAAKVIRANNQTLNYKQLLTKQLSRFKGTNAEKIDSILSFYYHKGQFNGTALVKYKGSIIFQKGYGFADNAAQRLNTSQTQFRIGSTSKQFTAMLIMQLAHKGKLQLQDTAGKYLPGFRNGRVTIEQLLTHQSGIPNYLQIDTYAADILVTAYTTDQLVQRFCSDPPDFEPGTKMHYSNSGFVVLAAIAEKITGKSYNSLLKEHIFIPLGMTHSYFTKAGEDTTQLATGYVYDQPEIMYPIQNETGAGGITSTAEDLVRWHDGLTSNALLPATQMSELFKPRVKWDDWGADYGYGWMIDRLQFKASGKHTIQYHPGTEVGFYDMLVRQPDKDIFIILLNNHGDFPRFDMTDLILDQLN